MKTLYIVLLVVLNVQKKDKTCTQCGNRHAQPFYHKLWFWIMFVAVILNVSVIFNIDKIEAINAKSQENKNVTTTEISSENSINLEKKEVAPVVSEEDYKSQCLIVDYKDVARNPGDYNNYKAVFTGEVIQVMEGDDGNVCLRVNVTEGEYGMWKDTVYVDYCRKTDDESRILEDDIITMYGELKGLKTYTSVLNSTVSIPYFVAEYIELTE